jgi:hypothetical protein
MLRSEMFEMRTNLGTEGKRQEEEWWLRHDGGRKGKRKMIDSADISLAAAWMKLMK